MSFTSAKAAWLKVKIPQLHILAEQIYGDYAATMQYRRDHPDEFEDDPPIERNDAEWCLDEADLRGETNFQIAASLENIILWQAGFDEYEGERL